MQSAAASENSVWLVTWLLRLMGVATCLALFPIFMPLPWMHSIHSAIGLGDMPTALISEYLARSLSTMYFAHSIMVLAISSDVLRYKPLVGVVGCLNVALGLIFLGIDLFIGMPIWWTLAEGPPILAAGLVVLLLWKRLPPA